MTNIVVVTKILFLVMIAHSFVVTERVDPDGSTSVPVEPSVELSSSSGESELAKQTTSQQTPSTTMAIKPRSDHDVDEEEAPVQVSGGGSSGNSNNKTTASLEAANPTASNTNSADLCYLSDGGSSMTLAINEATPLGSIVGTVEVNGDPTPETGNIELVDTPFEQPQSAAASSTDPLASAAATTTTTTTTTSKQQQLGAARLFGRALTRPSLQPPSPGPIVPVAAPSGGFYSLLTTSQAVQAPATSSNQPFQAALKLEPGTRNLILVRPLDKEGAEGEQSTLAATLHCRPRQRQAAPDSQDPPPPPLQQHLAASRIPIRILITDANDHAPEFQSTPYVINISETAPVGSIASRDIRAVDRDAAGPHSTVHYRVLNDGTAQSQLFAFESPLEPTLLVAQPLDYESQQVPNQFNITIVATDQSDNEPLSGATQIRVSIMDFDDQNPKFLDGKYTLLMDDTQQSSVGQTLRLRPNNLRAEDGDKGINAPIRYSFEQPLPLIELNTTATTSLMATTTTMSSDIRSSPGAVPIERYLHLSASNGELKLLRQWPSQWNGSPMTLVVRATQQDNRDRYALTTLTIVARAPTAAAASSRSNGGPRSGQSNQQPSSRAGAQARANQAGLEFVPSNQVSASVSEDAPLNERVAQVRARLIAGASDSPAATTTVPPPHQAVDLINDHGNNNDNNNNQQQQHWTLANAKMQRPITYQIIDEPSDHFGITQTGDLYLRRALDYEQKQEYRFRVLATHSKHSDICHVHINVVNTNDNKPKFTLPQYSFHLSESRLRNSNVIGVVHATDNDLNDTVQYSLATAQCLNASSNSNQQHQHQQPPPSPPIDLSDLFELGPLSGQLALKQQRQQAPLPLLLNTTTCHLVVHANDSLGPVQARHSQSARITLHVAPSLIGRSLNDLSGAQTVAAQSGASSTTNARSLTQRDDSSDGLIVSVGGEGLVGSGRGAGSGSGGNQVQVWRHNGGNSGIKQQQQQQPPPPAPASQRSSVATVVASLQHMARSVSFLEMPMSSALVLAGLLAFLVCLLIIVIVSMSVHVYRRSRLKAISRRRRQHLSAAAQLRNHAHLSAAMSAASIAAARSAGSAASSLSGAADYRIPSATPTSSGPKDSRVQRGRQQGATLLSSPSSSSPSSSSSSRSNTSPTNSTPAGSSPTPTGRRVGRGAAGIESNVQIIYSSPTTAVNENQATGCATNKSSPRLTDQQSLLQLSSLTTSSSTAASPVLSMTTTSARLSKRSYHSTNTTTDDSSVMHCGHYSVANAGLATPTPQPHISSSQTNGSYHYPVRWSSNNGNIKTNYNNSNSETLTRHNDPSLPGIKSYRKLPLMDSLARTQLRNNKVSPTCTNEQVNDQSGGSSSSFSAIAMRMANNNINNISNSSDSTLMAMVRDQRTQMSKIPNGDMNNNDNSNNLTTGRLRHAPASVVSSSGGDQASTDVPVPMPAIKWPAGAFPQRVKRLTWDDELSSVASQSMSQSCDMDQPLAMDLKSSSSKQLQQQSFLFAASSPDCVPGRQTANSTLASPVPSNIINDDGHNERGGGSGGFRSSRLRDLHPTQQLTNQNNHLDYTIVQSCQFSADSLQAALTAVDDNMLMSPVGSEHQQQQRQVDEDHDGLDKDGRQRNGATRRQQPARVRHPRKVRTRTRNKSGDSDSVGSDDCHSSGAEDLQLRRQVVEHDLNRIGSLQSRSSAATQQLMTTAVL